MMRPLSLKTLSSNWMIIAQNLTKTNERSLSTFRQLILSETLSDLLRTRRSYSESSVFSYITSFYSNDKENKEIDALNSFSFYILTVELPTLGKDLLRGLTTGRFENTSTFTNAKNSHLPKFLYECFIHIFDVDGYIRSNHKDVAALRQILMMYYKFELPFTEEQELEAHSKFIETDKRIKTFDYPLSLPAVRNNFLSCLPDNPFDIRPHHSNGATNTKGVNNSVKRTLIRRDMALLGLYAEYFDKLPHSIESCDSTFNSKLTVVPKDSRGPRTICMEPHERMFIQKGIMLKLYDYIQHLSPARGFINFDDQTVNQKLAYKASIDGAYATIDLKDASDMVPWNLISSLVLGTDWYEALDVTRARVTTTLLGDITLNKFAPMGSALCFPIEALLFWSIAKTASPRVYVYGDDIIVPTGFAGKVMSALESYGLMINHDKSLTTGFFRESCGGDYFHGHNIGIVQCKSLDFVSFAEFVNLLVDKFGNADMGASLISNYETSYNHYFPRTMNRNIISGFYKANTVLPNHVFLKRRYNSDLQRYEFRVLAPDTAKIANSDMSDDALYRDWLYTSTRSSSYLEDSLRRHDRLLLNSRYDSFFSISFSGENQLVKKREKLKFTWTSEDSFYDSKVAF